MKSIPPVMKYMSTTPHSIDGKQTIAKARDLMKAHSIRHLPVMDGGNIQGIVSERDLNLALSISGVDATRTTIAEISRSDVFLAKPDAPLDGIVRVMAEKKLGSVLVVDNHVLVGIFTAVDALQALDELLNSRLTHV